MKKLIAEFIGTAVLVIFGCGTITMVGCTRGGQCSIPYYCIRLWSCNCGYGIFHWKCIRLPH